MKTRHARVAASFCAAMGLLIATAALAQSAVTGTVVTLKCPGATLTVASDINDSGAIVGRCAVSGVVHGFLYEKGTGYDDGVFTVFDFPGAIETQAWGINERGDIAGYYKMPGDTVYSGFVRSAAGNYTSLDRPNLNIMAGDINNAGFVVGCLHNPGTMHGWIAMGGTPVALGRAYEMYTDVNESGTVLGWGYAAPSSNVSFTLSGVGRTEIQYPGATNTQGYGLNQQGHIVGWFGPGTGGTGFRLRDGVFSSIAVPGATYTRALGINSAGHIVGMYRAAGATSGFVLVPSD